VYNVSLTISIGRLHEVYVQQPVLARFLLSHEAYCLLILETGL
jgi:hypothetical protein